MIGVPFIAQQPALSKILQLLGIMFDPGAKDGRLRHRAAVRMFGLRGFGKTTQRPRHILPPDPGNTEVIERGSIPGDDLKRALETANGVVQSTLFQKDQA